MGNESTSLNKASLKPGYFVTYSFSPVLSPPSPASTETEKQERPAMQDRQEVKEERKPIESLCEEHKDTPDPQSKDEQFHIETTEEELETVQAPYDIAVSEAIPSSQPSTVDYSDVSAARAALTTRLKAAGKAQPLSNGELLEAMYRNKRKKTEVRGGTGEVECRPQQSVAALRQQFSRPSQA